MGDPAVWGSMLVQLSVFAGGVVQGSIGFGFALVSTAALGLVEPDAIPGALLLLSFPTNIYVLARERGALDRLGLRDVVIGLAIGTPCGAVVLLLLSEQLLTVAFGAAIIAASGMSAIRPASEPGSLGRVAGGVVSGMITTVASTGGPAIALLFQRRPGPQLRTVLAAAFLVSGAFSVVAVALAGRLGWFQARVALISLPALAAGLLVSRLVAHRLDGERLRGAVLVFSAASGAAAIVRVLA